MIDSCRQHNAVESILMFLKLFSLYVMSELFFPHSTRVGVGVVQHGGGCRLVGEVQLGSCSLALPS